MTFSAVAIATQLKPFLQPDQIRSLTDLDARQQRQIQAAGPVNTELLVIYPATQDELARIVATAHQQGWTLLVCGQGSKLAWGNNMAPPDLVLSTAQLNRVIDHAVGDLTVTVEAGVKLADLQQQLAPSNQFVALEPAYPDQTTIGGLVATRDAGALRHRYGGVRDQVLGITFVRHDGRAVKAGGRVVKNVAGYDLMKLFAGSFGTLGVLSQVTLRLYPLPADAATVLFWGERQPIATLTQTLLNSALTPAAVDVFTPQLFTDMGLDGEVGLAVRCQGVPDSVAVLCDRIRAIAPETMRTLTLVGDSEVSFWQRLQTDLWQASEALVAKFGVVITTAPHILSALAQMAQTSHLQLVGRCHAGSGLGIVQLVGADISLELLKDLRSHCHAAQGFFTILEAPAPLKSRLDVWGYNGNAFESMRKIKEQFDPHSRFNPGRFINGL